MKKTMVFIISFLFMIFMSGCVQIVQLNDRLIIQGIGVDYESNEYEVTLQVLNIKNKGGNDSSSETPSEMEIVKGSGRTVVDAISNIREKSGKEPLFSQTLVIIIGSSAAENGLKNFMDFFTRGYEFSPLVGVLISDGKASEVLTLEKDKEIVSAENILAISKTSSSKDIGLDSNIGNLVADCKNEYLQSKVLYIDMKEESDNKELIIERLAVFKDDKLFDVLDDEMTKGFLLIKKRAKDITDVVFSEELSNVSYSIVDSKSKIKISEKEKLEICLPVKVEIKILETDKQINNENYSSIKNLVKLRLEKIITNVIEQTLVKDEADIFGFSSIYLRKNFISRLKSPEELKNAFKNANFKVDVAVNIESDK